MNAVIKQRKKNQQKSHVLGITGNWSINRKANTNTVEF